MTSSADETQFSHLADSVLLEAEKRETREFEAVWRRFHSALKRYVSHRLSPRLNGRGQASDIAQSALVSFWKKLDQGVVSTENADSLWPYLVTIARRKLSKLWKQIYSQKRGAGKEFAATDVAADSRAIEQVVLNETELQLEADLETLLSRFDTDTQLVCSMKLAGMTNQEISEQLQFSLRKVERKGELLRKVLKEYIDL